MKPIKQLLIFFAATLTVFACGRKTQETTEHVSNLIEFTNQQFATDSMQLGKIETRVFENTVKCNGTIVPFPDGLAKVNAAFQGVVKKIYCHNGQFVGKNQPLVEISGNEIIDIQNEYAEAAAKYKRSKSEYDRIKTLYNEKVTSEKDFMLAETEFKTSQAKYTGLKLKLETIGFTVSGIENGEFYPSYSIKSSIAGYISNLNIHIGSYIDTQTELFEIINPEKLQIKLSVFAKEINDLKKGQLLRFKSVNSNDVHLATISSIGVGIDNLTKSIDCYATINDKAEINPIANDFIEAEIITNTDTAMALPSTAIIKSENAYSVLVLNKQEGGKYFFDKVDVKIGRQHEGFTEIMDSLIDGKIITHGVYNISL